MKNTFYSLLLLVGIGSMSCKDKGKDDLIPVGKYDRGIFVLNEGPFGSGSGTLDFYNSVSNTLFPNVFEEVNNRPLGNIGQSFAVHNNKGYLVVNNANKIEVVNMADLKSTGVINGLELPRYFLGIDDNTAFVTEWGADGLSGKLKVINLNTLAVTKTIPMGKGPEKMLRVGDRVFIGHSGGFDTDSSLYIVNVSTQTVEKVVKPGDNPSSIALHKDGNVWVLCSGYTDFGGSNSRPGVLVKYSADGTYLAEYEMQDPNWRPNDLCFAKDGETAFFNTNGYGGKIAETKLDIFGYNVYPESNVLTLNYNTATEELVFCTGNFSSNGSMYIRKKNASGHALVDSFEVGIVPTDIVFR